MAGRRRHGARRRPADADRARTIPANAGTPTRFLARGGRRRRCGAGGGVGRSSDGRHRRHGAAAEGGKKWRRPGTRVRVSRVELRAVEERRVRVRGPHSYPRGGHGREGPAATGSEAWRQCGWSLQGRKTDTLQKPPCSSLFPFLILFKLKTANFAHLFEVAKHFYIFCRNSYRLQITFRCSTKIGEAK